MINFVHITLSAIVLCLALLMTDGIGERCFFTPRPRCPDGERCKIISELVGICVAEEKE
ncbi:hypothetical protein C0J52_13340 [Blattella germanica]|nr:hypothetical protein C0J52_13340 [Blattella germanica]